MRFAIGAMLLVVGACAPRSTSRCVHETTPRGTVDGCRGDAGAWTGPWKRTRGTIVLEEATYDAAGELDGPYVSRYPDGTAHATGQYAHGQRVGHWVLAHENGTPWIDATFERGVAHGDWRETHANGATMFEGHYEHGVLEGTWTTWHPDGTVRATGHSKAGRLDGTLNERGPEGGTSHCAYRDNRLNGRCEVFDPAGKLLWTGDFVDGVAVDEPEEPK